MRNMTVTLSKEESLADKYLSWSVKLLRVAERIESKKHDAGDAEYVAEQPRRISEMAAAKAKLLLS